VDEVLQVFANWQKLAKLDRAAEGTPQPVVTAVLGETADLRKLPKHDRAAGIAQPAVVTVLSETADLPKLTKLDRNVSIISFYIANIRPHDCLQA